MSEHAFFAQHEAIQDEAARLLADVYALYEFEVYTIFNDPRDSFCELFSFVADRTELSLMKLAALARANDDAGAGLSEHTKRKPSGVGVLTEGGKKKVLSAREACNKIIHAKTARFRLMRSKSHPIYQHLLDKDFPGLKKSYMRPRLLLTGARGKGKEWSATLDVVQWVHAVIHFSTTYIRRTDLPQSGDA
jgi:hypothetical protein